MFKRVSIGLLLAISIFCIAYTGFDLFINARDAINNNNQLQSANVSQTNKTQAKKIDECTDTANQKVVEIQNSADYQNASEETKLQLRSSAKQSLRADIVACQSKLAQ